MAASSTAQPPGVVKILRDDKKRKRPVKKRRGKKLTVAESEAEAEAEAEAARSSKRRQPTSSRATWTTTGAYLPGADGGCFGAKHNVKPVCEDTLGVPAVSGNDVAATVYLFLSSTVTAALAAREIKSNGLALPEDTTANTFTGLPMGRAKGLGSGGPAAASRAQKARRARAPAAAEEAAAAGRPRRVWRHAAAARDYSRRHNPAAYRDIARDCHVGARDTLTNTVARLIAEAAEQKDAGEKPRAVIQRDLRSRLAAAEAFAAHYRKKARDATSKLYQTKYKFLKRKMEVEDDDEEQEEGAETGDEGSGASDSDEPQRARRDRPSLHNLAEGSFFAKYPHVLHAMLDDMGHNMQLEENAKAVTMKHWREKAVKIFTDTASTSRAWTTGLRILLSHT
eukprot:jgi/Tetstr1/428766/TSEL_018754.t1